MKNNKRGGAVQNIESLGSWLRTQGSGDISEHNIFRGFSLCAYMILIPVSKGSEDIHYY